MFSGYTGSLLSGGGVVFSGYTVVVLSGGGVVCLVVTL